MNKGNKSPVTAILTGAGLRGREVYGEYALKNPDKLKFVAVADPNTDRRRAFQDSHNIPNNLAFESWDTLFSSKNGRLADAAFICTQDNLHYRPALAALKSGYHLVLEKPISPSLDECREIAATAKKEHRKIQVCHVLRFTGFWQKIKELVDSGHIGRVIHYDHSENVSYWHFGHSYVRGNYKNESSSSPFILAKSCHDLDLMYWIIGNKSLSVQSMGDLTHYRPANAPSGSPERCTDRCPESETCPWYAPRMYLTGEPLLRIGLHAPSVTTRFLAHFALNHRRALSILSRFNKRLQGILNWNQFPATVITTDLSHEGKMKALREGPYGRCIYKSGNDVLDHQISTYKFPGGITGTLTLHGLSELEGREIRIFGSKGVIRGYFRYNGEQITLTDFLYTKPRVVYKAGMSMGGHGGGDFGLMESFVKVMRDEIDFHEAGADIDNALEAHYMAFAAENARTGQQEVSLDKYR
ncbi:Gfo/Idh/MocA family protein [Phosphitispora sp. TUW77]|uniref:Gfo/Idh/MocA family protein n=1 Tax=Phosphitispora sp. TUW77 TaxID=3152361 RepID=UPI003AB15A7C